MNEGGMIQKGPQAALFCQGSLEHALTRDQKLEVALGGCSSLVSLASEAFFCGIIFFTWL